MTTQARRPEATWKWLRVLLSQAAQQVITDHWIARAAHTGTYGNWLASNGGGGPAGLNYAAFLAADHDAAPFPLPGRWSAEHEFEPTTLIVYDEIFLKRVPVAAGLAKIALATEAIVRGEVAEPENP